MENKPVGCEEEGRDSGSIYRKVLKGKNPEFF